MLLTAAVTKDELVGLLESIVPLTIVIDEARGRRLSLTHPRLELVPRRGIRIRGEARLTWDVAGVGLDVRVQTWQLLLEPRMAAAGNGAPILTLTPVLERLETKGISSIVDAKIAEAVDGALVRGREKLTWELARRLSKRIPMTPRVGFAEGRSAIELAVVGGSLSVNEEDVTLDLRYALRAAGRADEVPQSGRNGVLREKRPAM